MHRAFALIADARKEELGGPEQEQPGERLEERPEKWHGGNAIVEGRTKDIDGHPLSCSCGGSFDDEGEVVRCRWSQRTMAFTCNLSMCLEREFP